MVEVRADRTPLRGKLPMIEGASPLMERTANVSIQNRRAGLKTETPKHGPVHKSVRILNSPEFSARILVVTAVTSEAATMNPKI